MIRPIKLTVLLLFVFVIHTVGQNNLYDCKNSKNFATYLFNTGQYELSKHELERINFFCDFDSTIQLMLLKSYRKLNLFKQEELFYVTNGIENFDRLSGDFRDEYIRLLMTEKRYGEVQKILDERKTFSQQYEYRLGTELLLKNWEKAYQISQTNVARMNFKIMGLKHIAEKSYGAKRKSPWLAALMSVVLPGSGKAYCGYWGDGAISFTFTASTAFFAIRGFNKYGTRSVYPWIIGGLAVSYYAANIYGGATSAKRYNNNLDYSFINETEKVLYSDY